MRSKVALKRWTKAEMDVMRRHYGRIPNSELSSMLGRSVTSIEHKASSVGLSIPFDTHPIKKFDTETVIQIRQLGKNERIPLMPGLLDLLNSMSGSVNSAVVEPNAGRRAYLERIETFRPQIDDLLKQGVTGYKIAQEIGVPKGTVYGYIKEMRAA